VTTGDPLIAAYMAWDAAPTSRSAVVELQGELIAMGLDDNAVLDRIAEARRSGMSIPDAVQTVTNERGAAT